MREFDKKRKKIVEKLNLPESCIYCKGLNFNCQGIPACEKYLKYNVGECSVEDDIIQRERIELL